MTARAVARFSPFPLCAYLLMERSVRPFVIRSEQDLWRAVHSLNDGFAPGTRFAGWPVLRIRSSLPIDGVKSAFAVMKMQDAVNRLFCLMRYGTRSLRRMSALDKERLRLGVTYHDGNRGLDIDFTNAANACVSAVEAWGEHGPYDRPRQTNLFALPHSEEANGKESWSRTTRELGLALIAKLPRRDVKAVAMFAICAFALVAGGVMAFKVKSETSIAALEVGYEHQVKMTEPGDKTAVKSEAGVRQATSYEVQAVERDLAFEAKRVMALVSDEIEQPLLRFVMNEVDGAMPPLMEMAPQLATYSVNGVELPGRSAVAVGKAMRKQQNAAKKRRDTLEGWEPQVQETHSVTS